MQLKKQTFSISREQSRTGFELCRGEKRCMKMNVFDRPRAEPNKVRAMPSEEKAHGYEHKNFGEYSPDYTIYFL